MVSEAYSLIHHHKNEATTYNGNIKDVGAHSCATDGAVKEINNKTSRDRQKRDSAQGGKIKGGTGGDVDYGSTTNIVNPPLL